MFKEESLRCQCEVCNSPENRARDKQCDEWLVTDKSPCDVGNLALRVSTEISQAPDDDARDAWMVSAVNAVGLTNNDRVKTLFSTVGNVLPHNQFVGVRDRIAESFYNRVVSTATEVLGRVSAALGAPPPNLMVLRRGEASDNPSGMLKRMEDMLGLKDISMEFDGNSGQVTGTEAVDNPWPSKKPPKNTKLH